MILTVNFLNERHKFWSNILKNNGIFDQNLKQIPFEIKYNVKSYNGIFRVRRGIEKIIIYPPTRNIDLQWVDNILVHEMIHQYIYDNCLKDTSSHGAIFKRYMNKINSSNIGVKISVATTRISKYDDNKESIEIHKILVLKFADKFYLCKVKSSKVNHFTELILTHKFNWKEPLKGYGWYKSKSALFNNIQSCVTKLHGVVYANHEWNTIFEKFKLTKFEVIEEL